VAKLGSPNLLHVVQLKRQSAPNVVAVERQIGHVDQVADLRLQGPGRARVLKVESLELGQCVDGIRIGAWLKLVKLQPM
jgi:hypothetical protein